MLARGDRRSGRSRARGRGGSSGSRGLDGSGGVDGRRSDRGLRSGRLRRLDGGSSRGGDGRRSGRSDRSSRGRGSGGRRSRRRRGGRSGSDGDGGKLATGSRVALDLAIANLADGDGDGGGDDLGLTVTDDGNDSGGDHGGSNDVAGGNRGVRAAREDAQVNGRALRSPASVVQVGEVSRLALVEGSRATESEGAVATDGEARGVDDTGLGRAVELELVVGDDGANAALGICENAVLQGQVKSALLAAVAASLVIC